MSPDKTGPSSPLGDLGPSERREGGSRVPLQPITSSSPPLFNFAHCPNSRLRMSERPRCPQCHAGRIMLDRIEPGRAGADLLTFKCPKCNHTSKKCSSKPDEISQHRLDGRWPCAAEVMSDSMPDARLTEKWSKNYWSAPAKLPPGPERIVRRSGQGKTKLPHPELLCIFVGGTQHGNYATMKGP